MKIIDYIKPKTIDEAFALMKQQNASNIIMSGGTSFQFLPDDIEKTAIDINAVLPKGIKAGNSSFTIGAATTIVELQEYSSSGWILNRVASKQSTQQIRNMSTLGGNIARVFPWSDFPVALLALDAQILVSNGTGQVFSSDYFFKRQPAHRLKNKTLITAIKIPKLSDDSGFGYHKEVRTSGGFSTLTIAAYLNCKNNVINEIKVAAGAALSLPIRLKSIEEALVGKPADNSSFEKTVPSLIKNYPWRGKEGASNEYSLHLAKITVIDALKESLQYAKGRKHD